MVVCQQYLMPNILVMPSSGVKDSGAAHSDLTRGKGASVVEPAKGRRRLHKMVLAASSHGHDLGISLQCLADGG